MDLKRRQLLGAAAGTTGIALAGCTELLATAADRSDDNPITPVERTAAEPDAECGLTTHALSELLTAETGDPESCFEGATPDLVIENEREESIDVDIELESEETVAESYSIAGGDRVIERNAFEATDDLRGTVTIDDEEWKIRWPERSCHRYGIAVQAEDLEIGWIDPISGPGDTQHDCYPGSTIPLEIGSVGEDRTVAVTVTDRCDETTSEYDEDLEADGHVRIDDVFESGGVYEIGVAVDGDEDVREEFDLVCWGLMVQIREDGTIAIEEIPID